MNDAFGHPQSVVVLGGTSEIARAVVDVLVAARCRTVVLAGRDSEGLARAAALALESGAELVDVVTFDATDVASAKETIGQCFAAAHEAVDLVLVAVGLLGDSREDVLDSARIAEVITTNFTWPALAIGSVAERLRAQGHGRIVVLSSVAAVRPRLSNFLYGSAKAGLDGFALGLSETLRGSGVLVHIVRPGFVHTKMTSGHHPAPFAVGPEAVASAVLKGIETNRRVVWVPSFLKWVFPILRNLPQSLWRHLPG